MKQIVKFPDYSITEDGRIWSNRFNRWLKPRKLKKGYLGVCLRVDKKQQVCSIHRHVLETYIGPRPEGMQCRHLNGNKHDNRIENLCWGTAKENQQDSIRHGVYLNLRPRKTRVSLNTSEKEMIFYARHYNTCTIQELADTYYVCRETIMRVAHEYKPEAVAV